MSRSCRVRAGFTLVEVMTVLLVCATLAAGAMATFVSGSRLGREAADRAEMIANRSLAGTLMSWETRAIDARQDGLAIAADSIAQRVFRGRAIVCKADSTRADVRYSGLRGLDPNKDSLLVLAGQGGERAVPLTSATTAATACTPAPGETTLVLRPGAGLAVGDVLLVFERGSYHLTSAALRYRRGAGGRQPLTAETLFDDSTDLSIATVSRPPFPAESVAIQFRSSTRIRARPTEATSPELLRIPLLNVPVPLDSLRDRP